MRTIFVPTIVAFTAFAAAAPAQGQFFNYNPYVGGRGYGGYGGYGYGTYYGRAGGFLMGASSLVNASGKLEIATQQAKLLQQQIKQEKIRTQRIAFDEHRYEQMLTPTVEETRQFQMRQEMLRSRNDPPLTEIWSGKALNDLLKDLQKLQSSSGGFADTVPLDAGILSRINVTNGSTAGGNSRILREAKLQWPLPLHGSAFAAERKKIDRLLPTVVQQAKAGSVDDDTLSDLIAAVRGLNGALRARIADIPSTDYIRAKRYVRELESATRVLQDPDVANYFGKWAARGKDVAELVKNMTGNGLQFAPATHGDQAAYTALHRAMATYDVALAVQIRGPELPATSQGRLIIPTTQQIPNP